MMTLWNIHVASCRITTSVFSLAINHPAFGAAGVIFTVKSFLLAPGGPGKPRCPVDETELKGQFNKNKLYHII